MTSTNLTAAPAALTFTFNTAAIRVVTINDQPWFVASDVCRSIGYALKAGGRVNTSLAIGPLGAAERGTSRISTPGGPQEMAVISESGLYKLVMRSDKPQARAFQDWVTRDVLPAIRKDGAYVMGEEKVLTGEMSEEELILKAMGIMQAKITRLAAVQHAFCHCSRAPGEPECGMSSAEPFHCSYEPDQLMTIRVLFRVAWEMLEREGATDHASLYEQQDRLAKILLDLSLLDHNPTPETARLAVDRFLYR